MRSITRVALAVGIVSGVVSVRSAAAQAPCALAKAQVDSATSELHSVLSSGGGVVEEIRQEQKIPSPLPPVLVVKDAMICSRLATAFGHSVNRGDTFVVLRLGPIYYARDPYQRRGTGILTDTTYKVLARLGTPIK